MPAKKSPKPSPIAPCSIARPEARHLVVLDRVAVLVQDDVGVLGVVDAAVAEVQRVVGAGVERVVVAEVVDVDRDRAVVGVGEAEL